LIPIANRPLISYQLEFLESAGFEEVIVVASTGRNHDAVGTFLAEAYRGKLKAILLAFDPSFGSAELLVKLRERLVTDFIVVSGDLVVAEPRQFLHRLADTHRTKSAAITALAYRARADPIESAPPPPPPAGKRGGRGSKKADAADGGRAAADEPRAGAAAPPPPLVYLGIAAPNSRLVMYVNAEDVDEDDEEIALRKGLLRQVPRLSIRSDLVDAHLYIVSHWTLSLLPDIVRKGMVSLQADLLPILVRGQFIRSWRERAAEILRNDPRTLYDGSADTELDTIKCFVHVLDDAHYCRRVQTLDDFITVNRDVALHAGRTGFRPAIALTQNNFVDPNATVDPQAVVRADCVVGAGVAIGAGSVIQNSNIGVHCKIGANVTITNSVLLDHVTIEEGTKITNSILCSSSFVRAKCSLVSCTLGVSYDLRAASEIKDLRLAK
jgi:translation initiation factor eIF-2B subunit gamma